VVTALNFGPPVTAWPPNWGVWSAAETALDIGLGNWLKTKYCVYVLDRFWSRQWTNNNYCLIALIFTFCFYLYLNDNVQSRFMYTEACWTCVSFFICLFVWLTLGCWNGLARRRYCVMLSRPCKACLCGNSVSKHNLEWTFNGESFSKTYLCGDCWQPNNCLYYVKHLLCGNEVGCELLLSFFLDGLGSRHLFFWEVPRIFKRWSCFGMADS